MGPRERAVELLKGFGREGFVELEENILGKVKDVLQGSISEGKRREASV
jgi:hypothetical protein